MQENQTQKKELFPEGLPLEDRLLEIGTLNYIRKDIGKSQDSRELYGLSYVLTKILSKRDPSMHKNIWGDVRVSPVEAFRYAEEATESRANDEETKSLYQENKDKIIEEVVSAMEKDLEGVKKGSEAASILGEYLTGLFETPELDQATANKYAQDELANEIGVSMNFTATGSIQKYKRLHESLFARVYASKYLIPIKDNDKIKGYKVDREKIAKDMEDIQKGALIYTNRKGIAEKKKLEGESKK